MLSLVAGGNLRSESNDYPDAQTLRGELVGNGRSGFRDGHKGAG